MEPLRRSIQAGGRRLWLPYAVMGLLLAGGLVGAAAVIQPHLRFRDLHGHAAGETTYYCPMHPNYKSDHPGNCPICSMKLIPLETAPSPDVSSDQRSGSPEQRGASAGGENSGGVAPQIQISPERQQQIGVRFAEARRTPAAVEIQAVGKVAFDETQITHIHTKVTGWIEEVFADYVGAPVRKGQPLFTIYSPDLVASQQEYVLALRARRELGRSSFSEIADGARSLVDSARQRLELWDLTPAQLRVLEKTGQISRAVTVFSPVSGVVTERAAYHHGRYVTPDMDLYTIADLSRVWVEARVYESEMTHVRVGQVVQAVLPYDAERKPLEGRVSFVAPFLDPTTRTVQVRMDFPNADLTLKPETFVKVMLKRDLGPQLVVPREAVMDTGELQYVFVDRGKGYLEPRKVHAGAEVAEGGRVILDGLHEGERVVTAANFILDSESRLKGAFDAMTRPSPDQAPAGGSGESIAIHIDTVPSPAKVGKNGLRVEVRDASGNPIEAAEVGVRLFMPQMGSMAPMESKATLQAKGAGVYAGDVEIPMAWTWDTTVTVRKDGRVVGTGQTSITAR
jgi:RND family efflux transporter MFP subunit